MYNGGPKPYLFYSNGQYRFNSIAFGAKFACRWPARRLQLYNQEVFPGPCRLTVSPTEIVRPSIDSAVAGTGVSLLSLIRSPYI